MGTGDIYNEKNIDKKHTNKSQSSVLVEEMSQQNLKHKTPNNGIDITNLVNK